MPVAALSDDTTHDHSNDAPPITEVQVVDGLGGNIDLDDVMKVSDTSKVVQDSPMLESMRGASISTSVDQTSDGASVHSMPAVHITEPTSPGPQRPSPTSPEATLLDSRPPPPSPARSSTFQEEGSLSQQQRRARHRSAIEPRPNRLSGFFTNLMHRREPPHTPSREAIREDSAPPEPRTNSEVPSRASSPLVQRPVTPPPPPLPPPTLQELGLSLSALTTNLAPSHFSTPPASGAFLAPHYLLLCHAQGLDVLPLVSPPAPQPYALVRRVSFKSVVVMEQRGVLVAIAGRRDGVRVYALEEVKKAIEWRIDVEVRRERDRLRRENVKKMTLRTADVTDDRDSTEKTRKASLSTPPPGETDHTRTNLLRKSSHNPLPAPPSPPPVPLIPRSATRRTPKKRPPNPSIQIPTNPPEPAGHPPPYAGPSDTVNQPTLQSRPSFVSLRSRSRGNSVSNVLTAPRHRPDETTATQDDSKADWAESSDEEAIDAVAAGPSGTHLDERTSATLSAARAATSPQLQPNVAQPVPVPVLPRTGSAALRRNRPSNLDLSLTRSNVIPPPEPSPVPTLLTLRQALSHSLPTAESPNPDTPLAEADDDDEDAEGHISLAQALLESRIPDLPPMGTRRAQEPILITPSNSNLRQDEPSSPQTADGHNSSSIGRSSSSNARRRRRWSIMISSPSTEIAPEPTTAPSVRSASRFSRSNSFRSNRSQTPTARSVTEPVPSMPSTVVPATPLTAGAAPQSSRASRFFPRIFSSVLHGRSSEDHPPTRSASPIDAEGLRWTPGPQQSPPPKLEYVKLPGTKGALLVKAVETAKKSFLAILCGDSGEKVELFAGTYRTALGLSRTFILPDSPRSLELQLQGDDLVEVFLVFAQNVFGLEPATVRVREVRIGRAERRAARRRAREQRVGELSSNDPDAADEDTNVTVSIGVAVPTDSNTARSGGNTERSGSPTLVGNEHPEAQTDRPTTPDPGPSSSAPQQTDELLALATAQMGPYTTFQQLGFAPKFPLASIADEYIIPPTYPSFLEYKAEYEGDGPSELSQSQFSPPGLPIPTPTAPSRWFYRDPKNVIHGPWKASLMQAWYKDGLLPPDLPVRREEDSEYVLLKDLRLQSVDPTQPFRTVAPPSPATATTATHGVRPLLKPISLLAQPRHFGPPALFFFLSRDDDSTRVSSFGRMGDVKRLEAFDVSERSVLVAMRQGGLEVVDLSDALLRPADESRTALPHYNPPISNVNRRAPYVWKIGTPIIPSMDQVPPVSSKGKGALSSSKKSSTGPARNVSNRADSLPGDFDIDPQDEVLFLGRKDDEVYFCERNASSFRILRLSPTA
ncbi:hypothetical protein NLJ89_g535 [Agrocybe chaxingu]|uniref:GYF domain-containing protein n=1 Tax=Agrocybe chaxingu TaxID=84603 RepID=A0A9W8TEQ6_9AGAR|nr:hypothetical protein NLJ89_g535 [Agrocybe chaxingu]